MCGCTVFVIIILGPLICPTEHVFSTSELQSHSSTNSPNNVYTSIRGEVFDLTEIAAQHQRVVNVVPEKSLLKYGGVAADDIFPVQVSGNRALECFCLSQQVVGQRSVQRLYRLRQPICPTGFEQRYRPQRSISRLPRVDYRSSSRLVFRDHDSHEMEQSCGFRGVRIQGTQEHGEQ